MRRMRIWVTLAFVALVALFAVACSGSQTTTTAATTQTTAATAPAEPTTETTAATVPVEHVKIADLMISSSAGTYIAIEKGYFKEQAIDLEFVTFKSGEDQIPLLATGQLDIGIGAISAGYYNSVAQGIDVKVVADQGSSLPGMSGSSLAVRKDLVDSGKYKDFKDLRGMKVANTSQAGATGIMLDAILKQGGLTMKDIEVVVMTFPNMLPAFTNKGIDAAIYQEPFTTLAMDQGVAVRVKRADEYYPDQQVGVLFYSPHFAAQGDAGKRFMVAYLKGVRDYVDAFTKGTNKDEVIQILTKYTVLKDPAIYQKMVPSGLRPDGLVNVKSMESDLKWYVDHGYVKQTVPMSKVVDNSYVEYAISKLGPYKK